MRYFDIQQNPECYRILNMQELQKMGQWASDANMPMQWGLDINAHIVLGRNIRNLMNEKLLFWVDGIPNIAFKQAVGSNVVIPELHITEVLYAWESIIDYLTNKQYV